LIVHERTSACRSLDRNRELRFTARLVLPATTTVIFADLLARGTVIRSPGPDGLQRLTAAREGAGGRLLPEAEVVIDPGDPAFHNPEVGRDPARSRFVRQGRARHNAVEVRAACNLTRRVTAAPDRGGAPRAGGAGAAKQSRVAS